MLYVVSLLSTGGRMVQVCRLGPKVASRLALFCIHHMNRVNSCHESHDDSTINIVLVIAILLLFSVATLGKAASQKYNKLFGIFMW